MIFGGKILGSLMREVIK